MPRSQPRLALRRFSTLRSPLLLALFTLFAFSLPTFAAKPTKAGKGAAKAEEKKEEPKWDVNAPGGPSREVPIDVTEGTWMSLDVSPDGQEIVFDLLGDLYTIPITGGDAKALTHDVAWQEQPTYSPDGQWIAFTSDQAGGDNLWIAKRDGSGAKQISKESFRLLNSPTWSPDGQYVAGRKHLTTQRSAGTGEIWLYHTGGGGGLQMTKRPSPRFQKDIGEPVFSPDGRYLYLSRDATEGEFFEYNKDPNGQIYVIDRLDRESGETETIVAGSGGAIRPTPSPDGNWLAFVRRVRGKSVLHKMDLRSGEVFSLWDGLDRDLQETWAIHGVYPRMAWTPDSKSIVFWAGGKINRLDAETKAHAVIPFRVKTTRRVFDAVRQPHAVHTDKFTTKMLRWVQTSPTGDRVVYQALGKLWVKDLPSGTPRRLTSQESDTELYPAFSRDGQWIVYTTWHDTNLGAVKVVSSAGGEGRALTTKKGHYVEPVFSPDGQQVVYRRIGGGFLRTTAHSMDQGTYRIPIGVPTSGQTEPFRIAKDGALPQFGAANDRIFLTNYAGDGSSELISIETTGREPRTVAKGSKATEYRVSPDGKWIAFVELWNVYVAPFPTVGGPEALDLSKDTGSIPLAKVTREAGWYVHWSGDSTKLHWALGPELFTRKLTESFAFLDGAPEKLPEPPTAGTPLGFDVASDAPRGTVAFVGARLVTMRGDEVIEDGTVVVTGNRIAAIGKRTETAVPAGARTVDARGKTIIPGLIDVHWHGGLGGDGIVPLDNWVAAASLGYGVTTIHDPSNDTETVFAAAELQRAGQLLGPRIYSTGTILYGADTNFSAPISNLEDAKGHLRRMKAVGAFSVKSYNQPRRDQRQQVLAAARELGMLVVPEGGSLFQHNINMVVDGHTGIEHSIPLATIYADVVQLWGATKVGYTPTLGVAYGGIWGENYWYAKTKVWEDQRLLSFVPREIVDDRSRRPFTAPDEEYNHIENAKQAKKLSDAGVWVQLGAHGQREGLAAHWEIWMFAQGGMTPLEALRSGTLRGAEYLGMDSEIGSLAPGKLADFVVLSKNPLDDIRNTTAIDQIIANGRVYDGANLDESGERTRKRPPFFWQTPGRGAIGTTTGATDED